ncbi:MAG: Hsp20 family protein [Alphaproteobacteria bacterium]|nr:Hsp20 family protein [Alphaproteobacteria bacterium]
MKCHVITAREFEERKVAKAVNFDVPFSYTMNDIFNDFSKKEVFQPKVIVDISETDTELKIMIEMPFSDKEGVDVIADKDILILDEKKGSKQENLEDDPLSELFRRSIRLPFFPKPHVVDVRSEEGVLILNIKKSPNKNINDTE